MILVNKDNFLVYTVMKNHDSVSKPKSTFYADYKKTDNIRIFVFSDMMSFAPAATAEKIPN